MSDDSFSEVTYTSWFSRLGNSFGGAVLGLVLFLVSFVVLYWNEGRAVDTARSLEEAGGAVVSTAADKIDPALDGKLVHVAGKATTADTLSDELFGVSAGALRLTRAVEMYQWKEEQKKETRTKLGGGQETVTTYSYVKEWSASPIDSSRFRSNTKEGAKAHMNPSWPDQFRSREQTAPKVTVGAFTLPAPLLAQIHTSEPLPVTGDDLKKLPSALQQEFQVADGRFYRGKAPASPELGDLRIGFSVVRPLTVSVIAEQSGETLRAYQPKSARRSIEILHEGDHSAQEMIRAEESANARLTWILRLVGFVLMALGIFLVLNPLKVFSDVLPFLGGLVGFVLGVFAALVAAVLSLITIAISWIAVRPLLGMALLGAAGVMLVGAILVARKRRARRAA